MTTTAPPVPPALGVNQEVARQDEFLSVRTLYVSARLINTKLNLGLSGSRIRNLVRRFVREGRSDIDFYTWFAYADHTGEQAVNNVLKSQGQDDGVIGRRHHTKASPDDVGNSDIIPAPHEVAGENADRTCASITSGRRR